MLKAIQIGQQLTKNEMKEIKGGCCAHYNVEIGAGGVERVCGLTMGQAQSLALKFALDDPKVDGIGGASWCCASC